MKLKSKEINVFSMSALDLFASGMGAFILLAVMAMPFFGNVSPVIPQACPVVECPVCKQCPEPKPIPVPPKPVPGFKKIESLDLTIVLDVTGSMDQVIENLQSDISDIAILLSKLADGAALRVVMFGDNEFDRPASGLRLIELSDIKRLKSEIGKIKVDYGIGSGRNKLEGEAVLAGFQEALKTPWRKGDQQKIIVIITDDEPHSGEGNALLNAVTDFASQHPKNRVSVKNLKPSNKAFYQQIANAGKGQYLSENSGSISASLILALLPK